MCQDTALLRPNLVTAIAGTSLLHSLELGLKRARVVARQITDELTLYLFNLLEGVLGPKLVGSVFTSKNPGHWTTHVSIELDDISL